MLTSGGPIGDIVGFAEAPKVGITRNRVASHIYIPYGYSGPDRRFAPPKIRALTSYVTRPRSRLRTSNPGVSLRRRPPNFPVKLEEGTCGINGLAILSYFEGNELHRHQLQHNGMCSQEENSVGYDSERLEEAVAA